MHNGIKYKTDDTSFAQPIHPARIGYTLTLYLCVSNSDTLSISPGRSYGVLRAR